MLFPFIWEFFNSIRPVERSFHRGLFALFDFVIHPAAECWFLEAVFSLCEISSHAYVIMYSDGVKMELTSFEENMPIHKRRNYFLNVTS